MLASAQQQRTCKTCPASRRPGWRHGRCTSKQSAPPGAQSGCFGSQSSVAAPRLHGTSGGADAAAADAAAVSATPAELCIPSRIVLDSPQDRMPELAACHQSSVGSNSSACCICIQNRLGWHLPLSSACHAIPWPSGIGTQLRSRILLFGSIFGLHCWNGVM